MRTHPISPCPEEWTFQTNVDGKMMTSSQVFDNIEGAAAAAVAWLTICAENGFFPAIGLMRKDRA